MRRASSGEIVRSEAAPRGRPIVGLGREREVQLGGAAAEQRGGFEIEAGALQRLGRDMSPPLSLGQCLVSWAEAGRGSS